MFRICYKPIMNNKRKNYNTTLDIDLMKKIKILAIEQGREPGRGRVVWPDRIRRERLDPDITELDLSGYIAVALVTPTRVGLTSVVDDSSLQALIDYADSGGNIYWEGPDAGTDYGDGSAVGRDFFALFGVDYAAETGGRTFQMATFFDVPPGMEDLW